MFKKFLSLFGYCKKEDWEANWKKNNTIEIQTEYYYLDTEAFKESQFVEQKKIVSNELKKALANQLVHQIKIEEVDIPTSKEQKIRATISILK